MLSGLSSIALEWAKNYVRQRQTFELNTKGENMAPLAFQHDPDGTYRMLAAELRSHAFPFDMEEDDTSPFFEPMEEGDEERTDLNEASTPPPKPIVAYLRRPLGPAIRKLPFGHWPALQNPRVSFRLHLKSKRHAKTKIKGRLFRPGSMIPGTSLPKTAVTSSSSTLN
jgi:hypothetical protein